MSNDAGRPVLALNVGSSSLKFVFFMVGASGSRVLVSGAEETVGEPQAALDRIAQRVEAQGLPRLLRWVTASFMVARNADNTR